MRDVLSGWFGPVTDHQGRRVRFRASRSALTLCTAAQASYAATVVLGVLHLIGGVEAPWWAATFFAAALLGVAARTRLRRSVRD